MSRIFASLIQGDFSGGDHRNFEAVIWTGDQLQHWFRDNSEGHEWRPGQVVVPAGAAGAGCLIQSDFADGDHGNFEVVVPMTNGNGGLELVHWFHVNTDVTLPWQRAGTIATNVAGPGCLIQSDFADGDHGNFEVVVPVNNGNGGLDLVHFFHDNTDVTLPWQRAGTIATNVAGPGCLIQSDFADGDHGNFEVVVPVPWGDGQQLRHFFHDNTDVTLPWQRGQFVTDSANGWASLISSDYGEDHRNFELIVEERAQSVIGYFHPNEDVGAPWLRNGVVRWEEYPVSITSTRRICQLTGEHDRTGWDGEGDPPFAHNRTESAYRVRGTDLGVSFPHRGRTYFLFGDTLRNNQPADWDNLDLVAYTQDTTPEDGLDLAFFWEPPRISDGISQRGFEVPLDAVSAGDHLYAFFSTDHRSYGGSELMGRSVITRCDDDGFAFRLVRELSRHKLVNVSVQRGPLDARAADGVGLPAGTDVLWIWGSGRYRSSDVYLAVVPFAQLEPGPFDVRYFAGTRTSPRWSRSEDDATPLFHDGSVGELSVRWQPALHRYVATYNSDNLRGIHLRSAPAPWGPWTTAPVMLFDPWALDDAADPCSGRGLGRFMHLPWTTRVCDHVQDDMFGHRRDDEPGGEYGPYQIADLTRARGGGADIYFTLSSWNPYQAHLMTAFIDPAVLG
ncbi:DUF4185 domain-containing protein [Angustibacter luteus]|uniref:DUF4185 domain-containing protein n=1 Tax=Angustibacter luteus TaxID=658456 RepID=A0ABW1JBA6_9ACTN